MHPDQLDFDAISDFADPELHEQQLADIAEVARVAFRMLAQSKDQIVEDMRHVIAKGGLDTAAGMLKALEHVRGLNEALGEILEAAQGRFEVALAAAQQDGTPAVH
jgi:hypothetical protein